MKQIIHSEKEQDILNLDASALSHMIKTGEITSEGATREFIDHIKRINPHINALVEDRFDEALSEARLLDKTRHKSNKPLHGVPISMKESFHISGMKTTGGISHRQDIIMSEDAFVVKKLKDAGAVILGKTNTPSLCFCQETDNKLYGRTNNPWNINHTASGSSGGEAALISAGGAALGFGSDIGGSIRFPSHFNGIIGFKSGPLSFSSEGHFPPSAHSLQTRMLGFGALAKSVRDAELVYEIILEAPSKQILFEKMQVDILPTDNGFPLNHDIGSALQELSDFLHADGHYNTNETIPPYFNDSASLWQEIMSIDGGTQMKKIAFNTDRPNLWRTYLREKTLKNTDTHDYLSWALIGANLFKPTKKRVREIKNILNTGDHILSGYLKNRLLIFPVYHRTAPKHGELYKEIFSINKTFLKYMPYTAYANVWALPSLTVPVAFDKQNLPIGIQIMSRQGNERAIFKLGKKIEEYFGGYKRSLVEQLT